MNPEIATSHIHNPSVASGFSRSDIIAELDHVSGLTLRRKASLRKMLQFVVEATLDGKAYALKEYTIATLVFGKAESFDPRMTSLVRTQASKLREALTRHYAEYPAGNGPWLWVPPGSYRAVFDHDPASHLKRPTFEDQIFFEPRLPACVRLAPLNVFPCTGKLNEISQAVVRLQRENLLARRLLSPLAEPENLEFAANHAAPSLEVEQTLVELDDRLLLTAVITAGPTHLVLFGKSVTIPWDGDAGKAISSLSAPLSEFASTCASLVESRAFGESLPESYGPRPVRWEQLAACQVPHVAKEFASKHDSTNNV